MNFFLSWLKFIINTQGIRAKVVLIVLGITVLLTLSTIFYVRATLRNTLAEQLDHRTISIARDVAGRSLEPILTDNIFKLHQLAHHAVENNEDVIYVLFVDVDNNILIHTFEEYLPPGILDVQHAAGNMEYSLKLFQTEEGVLRDVAVPVTPDQGLGINARLGLVDYSLQEAQASALRQLIFISVITFIIMIILVHFLITLIIIKPLNSLLDSVQAVSQGNLSQRAEVKAGDELSTLAKAFNTMTQQLAQAQQTRDNLMKNIIHSQEDERSRISRELHDETGQTLSTLMISLRLLEESTTFSELKHKTAEFSQLLQQSLEQVRLMAWKLTPTPLTDMGLKAALESYTNKYRNFVDWEINLEIDGMDNRRLPSEIELAVYRVIQEALTNIARHAHAETVDIFLNCHEHKLLVIIEDNGIGFDVEKQKLKNSLGLTSMQERISLVGGKLKVESTPGKGTTLYMRIPLPPPGNDESFS